jgi:vancomycin resistance protein YoaR
LKKSGSKFVVTEGTTGLAIDIVTSVNAISEDISKNWQNGAKKDVQYTLTTIVTNPRGSQEELAKVKDLLGSFSTDFSSSNEGRKKNVTTGCSKINGTLLYPGDTFSAYAATSPYTEKNGYGIGGAYNNGELVESMGGGICQVSTTLYNAAIRAELKITMRAAHSMVVSYVDPSVDAAIAGTYKDLRFRNDYDFPVYIEGYCKKGIITFNIYGIETRDPNRTIRFENEIVSVNDPDTEYTLDKNVKVGTYKVMRSEHVGYTARLYKIVSINGVDTEKIRMNKSTYKASCKKVTIGIKGATEEQIATIKEALKTKDDAYIKKVVKNINKAPAPTPEPTPSEAPVTPSETSVQEPSEAV